jgi:hypothetical protein
MKFSWEVNAVNARRIKISVALGIAAGAVCLYGTMTSLPGLLSVPILATIFYDRLLLGFVVGISYGLKIHPIIRGSVIGAAVSLLIAIPSGIVGGALLMGAGIIYGIIIDVVATKFSRTPDKIPID